LRLIINKDQNGEAQENHKHGDKVFINTQNVIIGSNKIALEAAKEKATDLGYNTIMIHIIFFNKTGEHIITGPTLTNVMDIMISLIN